MKSMTNDVAGVSKVEELRGWIMPCGDIDEPEARRELESFGITVGSWDEQDHEFQKCIAPLSSLAKLDPLWATRYIWGLSA